MTPPRRVITGLDAEGRSCFLFDGPAQTAIWTTDRFPADNSGTEDCGGDRFVFPEAGTLCVFHDFPAKSQIEWHATDTIDYLIVMSGEITFVTETGETLLRAGDVLVDRGNMHAWRNDSDAPCRIINVLVPALPAGKGATVSGEM